MYATHGEARVAIEEALAKTSTKDRRWVCPSTHASIDEFNDEVMDPAWVRVDAAGSEARCVWTEGGDVMSLRQIGTDPASQLHGLMRPIEAAMVVGDAFETCVTLNGQWAVNFMMSGLILADGIVHGAGAQVHTLNYTSTSGNLTNDTRVGTGYVSSGGSAAILMSANTPTFFRLVMTAANTWRCDVSGDGVSWILGTAFARTVTPTHVGLLCSSWGSARQAVISYEFLRRRAGVS